MTFETSVPAKWVLSGEHAVLRGADAVALPCFDFSLKFQFLEDPLMSEIELHSDQDGIQKIEIEKWLHPWINDLPKGRVQIQSHIPLGSGLGSSAALSVAVARWIIHCLKMDSQKTFEVAKKCEDYFHGKSSGMDVAVCSVEKPVLFSMQKGLEVLEIHDLPNFKLHDTQMRSSTKECIEKVQSWINANPKDAKLVDEKMIQASLLAFEGLQSFQQNRKEGLDKITQSMQLSHQCYQQWGLVPEKVGQQMDQILDQGALACRLSGAGCGGFIVALY